MTKPAKAAFWAMTVAFVVTLVRASETVDVSKSLVNMLWIAAGLLLLAALCYGVPRTILQQMIQGRIDDIVFVMAAPMKLYFPADIQRLEWEDPRPWESETAIRRLASAYHASKKWRDLLDLRHELWRLSRELEWISRIASVLRERDTERLVLDADLDECRRMFTEGEIDDAWRIPQRD